MLKKTKIVCTIGPASDSVETLKTLMQIGMNVCRLNFSHGSHEEHLQDIAFMISGSDSSKSALDSAKEIEKVIKNSERRV